MTGSGLLEAAAASAALALWILLTEKPEKRVRLVLLSVLLTAGGTAGIGLLSSACNMVSLPDAAAWFRGTLNECSFVGGCLGFVLAAAVCGVRFDRIAPAAAFMVCALRLAEGFFPPVGLGPELDEAIPLLSAEDGYGGINFALYLAEAVPAGICGAVLLLKHRPEGGFRKTAALLCAAQIVFENLRVSTLMVGFVRTEQVLCALVLLGMAVCGGRKGRLERTAGVLLLSALCGLWQFLTDKPYLLLDRLPIGEELYDACFAAVVPVSWLLTAICAGGMAVIALKGERKVCK